MLVSQCLFCNNENPQGAKFCNECGSPLHLRPCWHCDAVNDAASEACYKCGAPCSAAFATTASEAPTAVEPVSQVTDRVVFAIAPSVADESLPTPQTAVEPVSQVTGQAVFALAPSVADESLPTPRTAVEPVFQVTDRAVFAIAPSAADESLPTPQPRLRRRLAVALPPLALLGAIAIGSYYAYRNPTQLREWLGAARATASQDRGAAPVAIEAPKDVAAASVASTSSVEASGIGAHALAATTIADRRATEPPAADSAHPAESASSYGPQDDRPGAAFHVGPEDAAAAQVAVEAQSSTKDSTTTATADKNATSSPKARAKKSKKTTARKQDPPRK